MGKTDSRCRYCQLRCTDGYLSSYCPDEVTCTCKCNVGKGHDVAQKTAAVVGGLAAAAGGAALTVASMGTALPAVAGVAGAALAGAGLNSAIHGAVKAAKEEKIDAKEYFIDVAVGALGKGLDGGGAIATEKVASLANGPVAQCAVRMPGHTAAALGKAAVEEAGECAKGEKEWEDYGEDRSMWAKAATTGAATKGTSSCVDYLYNY